MSSSFMQIPVALDLETNKVIKPDRANSRSTKGRYYCLAKGCDRPLYVATSKNKKVHFRHYRGEGVDICYFRRCKKSQDLHTAAKNLLAIIFSEALVKRSPMPTLLFETPSGVHTVLPFLADYHVKEEWACKLTQKRIDIAIVNSNDIPLLLIEIKHTHAVDVDKRDALKLYCWIEVDAKDVVNNPNELIIRAHGNFPHQYQLLGAQGILL